MTAVTTREALARIINPSNWRAYDSYKAQALRKKDRDMDRPGRWDDKASLATADAILAYLDQHSDITEEDVRADLQRRVATTGSVAAVARKLAVLDEQLRLFLVGKRPLEPKLMKALGLVAVTRFRRMQEDR